MRSNSLKQLVGLLAVGACLALLILAAFGSAGTAGAQAVSFIARRDFAAGNGPFFVAVGDFNGDGVPDLVVANQGRFPSFSDGSVSVLLGNGDATFQAPLNLPAGISPQSVAVGDFNGDGVPDLAVANRGTAPFFLDGNVSVLLGNGDGTFQTARNFSAGIRPTSVAVGDFNGDGLLDLAVANFGFPNNVSMLLGNGDGSFQAPLNFAVPSPAQSVAVGDFNGDGVLDVAVATGSGVSALLGNGDGTFQAPLNFAAGSSPQSVAVGDFNGDGIEDLAVANFGSHNVSVLLGNGDGTFQAAQNFGVGVQPVSVAVGDFNGDGVQDLAVANGGGVSVLLGNGDGTFQPARNFAAGVGPSSVAVGDFNGDGVPDLAVANQVSSVSVLLGNGDGTFQVAPNFAAGVPPLQSVAVGEFNGDGVLDLAVANGGSTNVSVLLGTGDGTFQAAVNFFSGLSPWSIAVGDFNGDGVPDLAVANLGANVSVLLGNGDGTFQAPLNLPVPNPAQSVAVGDFNGDGKLDLAVADPGHVGPGNVSVLLGNGDGTFQAAVNYPVGTSSVVVGDFNGDGKLDLAVVGGGGVSVLLGNGDGTFQTPRSFPAGIAPISVAVGDFNGDGVPDLAVANFGPSPDQLGSVSVLLGNGDGTFQAPRSFAAGFSPRSVAVGDFNGDRIPDLAVGNSGSVTDRVGSVSVLLGNGDGTFQGAQNFAAGSGPQSVAVGDFNGDGKLDLAVANGLGVTVLINNTPSSHSQRPEPSSLKSCAQGRISNNSLLKDDRQSARSRLFECSTESVSVSGVKNAEVSAQGKIQVPFTWNESITARNPNTLLMRRSFRIRSVCLSLRASRRSQDAQRTNNSIR